MLRIQLFHEKLKKKLQEIPRKLGIRLHLLKKSFMKNFFSCAVYFTSLHENLVRRLN